MKCVQTGYGFIDYPLDDAGITAALEAVKTVHQLVIDSVKYSCRLGHLLEEYLKRQSRVYNQPSDAYIYPGHHLINVPSYSIPSAPPLSYPQVEYIPSHYSPPRESFSTYSTYSTYNYSQSVPTAASLPMSVDYPERIDPTAQISSFSTYASFVVDKKQTTKETSDLENIHSSSRKDENGMCD